ncbi:hypothetical protein AMTR_s00120p00042260, partial [Amborella trichopoda]
MIATSPESSLSYKSHVWRNKASVVSSNTTSDKLLAALLTRNTTYLVPNSNPTFPMSDRVYATPVQYGFTIVFSNHSTLVTRLSYVAKSCSYKETVNHACW